MKTSRKFPLPGRNILISKHNNSNDVIREPQLVGLIFVMRPNAALWSDKERCVTLRQLNAIIKHVMNTKVDRAITVWPSL